MAGDLNMCIIIKNSLSNNLTSKKLASYIRQITDALTGKVDHAYLFGSAATGDIHEDSDIDLIIIKETSTNFIYRPLEFDFLLDIYTAMDILVYTQSEFDRQLADSDVGFWKSVRESLVKII